MFPRAERKCTRWCILARIRDKDDDYPSPDLSAGGMGAAKGNCFNLSLNPQQFEPLSSCIETQGSRTVADTGHT